MAQRTEVRNHEVDTAKVWYQRQEFAPINVHFEFTGTEPDITVSLTVEETFRLQGQLTTLLAALEVMDKYSKPG